ncbi:hypothetical protein D9613_000187 [Agrocybe pediades]|uniref:Uncharacterized protein n=1 Tax=Agrocybe pediades TaxID=84607 RepID=A0A8H4VS62_9AGAR|nr:hypothetical protein D9613_000187 [Agrocybe pediades]
MLRLLTHPKPSSGLVPSTCFLAQLRHASSSKSSKKKVVAAASSSPKSISKPKPKILDTPRPKPLPSHPTTLTNPVADFLEAAAQPLSSSSSSSSTPQRTWRIEPQISYMESKLRQPKSAAVILATVGLSIVLFSRAKRLEATANVNAQFHSPSISLVYYTKTNTYLTSRGSIVGTSLAFPDPEEKEQLELELRKAEEAAAASLSPSTPSTSTPSPSSSTPISEPPSSSERPKHTFFSLLFRPVKFILRPIFASPSEREAAQQSWLFWAGMTSGLCAFSLFVVSHFASPRYVRMITVSSPVTQASARAGGATARTGSTTPEKSTPTPTQSSSTLWLTPFSGAPISIPLSQTTLVSPLFTPGDERVMKTIKITGAPKAYLGWGLCMPQRKGIVVNGRAMSQEDSIRFLESLWVQRGGRIDVA